MVVYPGKDIVLFNDTEAAWSCMVKKNSTSNVTYTFGEGVAYTFTVPIDVSGHAELPIYGSRFYISSWNQSAASNTYTYASGWIADHLALRQPISVHLPILGDGVDMVRIFDAHGNHLDYNTNTSATVHNQASCSIGSRIVLFRVDNFSDYVWGYKDRSSGQTITLGSAPSMHLQVPSGFDDGLDYSGFSFNITGKNTAAGLQHCVEINSEVDNTTTYITDRFASSFGLGE